MDILTKNLETKLTELKKYLSTASIQDLHTLFPKLVEDIFGFGDRQGWYLNERHGYGKVSVEVENFLKPGGPLIDLITTKLVPDSATFKYEFPVNMLPESSKASLHDLTSGSLFANKFVMTNGQFSSHLLLNPFEFYFFNFFVYIVHPKWREKIDWQGSYSSLYVNLLESYLRYYLFLEEKSLTLLGFVQLPKTSPISSKYSSYQYPVEHCNDRLINRLISSEPKNVKPQSVWNFDDFWQTTCIIQSAVEFWMNQTPAIKQPDFSSFGEYQIRSEINTRSPKADQINMVRVLMKYLYNFVYSKKCVIEPKSAHHQNILNKLQEYKNVFVLRYVSPRLYKLMSYCVDRWPYDLTFNIVLESWLTVIQPWRYQNSYLGSDQAKSFEINEWRPFVANNYALYANILWCLLLRLQRIDLQVYANAHMLFRVSKVFSQPNLKKLLRQVEDHRFSAYYDDLQYMPSTAHLDSHHNAGFLNFPSNFNGDGGIAFSSSLRSSGDSDVRSIWSDRSRQEARSLINDAQTAIVSIQLKNDKMGSIAKGFNSLKEAFGFGGPLPSSDNQSRFKQIAHTRSQSNAPLNTLTDYLRASIENLADFYDVRDALNSHNFSNLSFNTRTPPDCTIDEDGYSVLSPLGKYQIANNLRHFDIFLPDDPMNQPKQPYENGIILGFTNDISNHINARFSDKMESWCRQENYFGRLARQLFLLPTVRLLYQDEFWRPRNAFISPLTKKHLALLNQPRLNLRFLASYRLWLCLAFLYFFGYFAFGIRSVVLFGIFILSTVTFYFVFKVIFLPEPELLAKYPRRRCQPPPRASSVVNDELARRARPDLMSPTLRMENSG